MKEIKTPTKLAFFGDSITEYGWNDETGYVQQVVKKLTKKGYNIQPIPAGIAGHTSTNLLERMDRDIIAKQPNKMILMIGLNDIIYIYAPAEVYINNVKTIIKKAKENNIEVILTNMTIANEDVNSQENQELDYRNKLLVEIAKQENIKFIDVNSPLKEELKNKTEGEELHITVDDLHLNELGNTIVANEIVKNYKN